MPSLHYQGYGLTDTDKWDEVIAFMADGLTGLRHVLQPLLDNTVSVLQWYKHKFWEKEMKSNGHSRVLTSTMTQEKGQHFFRKFGYRDVGTFYDDGEGLELILEKRIQEVEDCLCPNKE